MRLHTAEGLWWLGLLLGLAALTVPVLSITGVRVWWSRRVSGRVRDNIDAADADAVILVGSENNATRGFAKDLHEQLSRSGRYVHSADMNELAEDYPKASLLFVLTSTYGHGDAPASANEFMEKLQQFQRTEELTFAVLGFGDRQFPDYSASSQKMLMRPWRLTGLRGWRTPLLLIENPPINSANGDTVLRKWPAWTSDFLTIQSPESF